MERKQHWENVYKTKTDQDVGWYQEYPETSVKLFNIYCPDVNQPIIDVGGGNSHLSRILLEKGYTSLTVLDLSLQALKRSQSRMSDAHQIKWIETDVLQFKASMPYQTWHDRAVFHFLLDQKDIEKYTETAGQSITPGGYLFLGTFSETGPTSCSGLPITQYSAEKLKKVFHTNFQLVESFEEVHITPSGNPQNFTWVVFVKK